MSYRIHVSRPRAPPRVINCVRRLVDDIGESLCFADWLLRIIVITCVLFRPVIDFIVLIGLLTVPFQALLLASYVRLVSGLFALLLSVMSCPRRSDRTISDFLLIGCFPLVLLWSHPSAVFRQANLFQKSSGESALPSFVACYAYPTKWPYYKWLLVDVSLSQIE